MSSEREKRPSKSIASYRRSILSQTRRDGIIDSTRVISEVSQASQRLQTIDSILKRETPESKQYLSVMSAQEQERVVAELTVERVWALLKAGTIDFAQKNSMLDGILGAFEKDSPDIFRYLTQENSAHMSPMIALRNKYFPPKTVGGFHTKR